MFICKKILTWPVALPEPRFLGAVCITVRYIVRVSSLDELRCTTLQAVVPGLESLESLKCLTAVLGVDAYVT